jgi:uncharacterized membrane protein
MKFQYEEPQVEASCSIKDGISSIVIWPKIFTRRGNIYIVTIIGIHLLVALQYDAFGPKSSQEDGIFTL